MYLTHVHAFVGRLVQFVAMQPAAQPSGGGHGPGGGGGAPQGGMFQFLMPFLIVAFIYFFMLRPMNKQRKEQEELNKSLRKGDKVVTTSGLIGTITAIDDKEATIEIAERVRVRMLRDSITRKYEATEAKPDTKSDAGKAAEASKK